MSICNTIPLTSLSVNYRGSIDYRGNTKFGTHISFLVVYESRVNLLKRTKLRNRYVALEIE